LKKILFLSFIFFTTLFAKESLLHLNKLDEISILNSLNINASFMNDPKYVKMKNNIDQLKTIYFLKALKKGSIFMPNLHELLGESDIPDTFLYMAMVESKFVANVKSNRNAAGLWQIMPSTAKRFKLEVNRNVDERLDPIKSTKAAIKYLQYLQGRFGKWYLAAIAYNCGETKLARVLKKIKTDDLTVLIDDRKKYLPAETRNYIRRIIIAALLAHDEEIIIKNNADHLFGNCTNSKLIEVFFNGGMTLKNIAKRVGMTVEKIKTCNPHILRSRLPANKKTYHIYLPQEHIADLDNSDTKISIGHFDYTVKKGDTLFLISKRFNNKMSAIKRLNPHLKKHLSIGQTITLIGENSQKIKKKDISKASTMLNIENLPLAKTITDMENLPLATTISETENASNTGTISTGEIFVYFVKKDDSVHSISLKFNNKISTLEELNPGFLKNFKEGMSLKIRH
jgi:membrane-bound lytic murein transglycosylase D